MKIPKRSTKANESSTSGSEGEAPPVQRTYAEVTTGLTTSGSDSVPPPGPLQPPHEGRQAPPGPPGPPRAEGRRSPSPVASGSGAQTAKSAKKRKRETGPEEISEAEARKANSLLKIEMAMIASRATDLEHTVAEHQECLDEATNAVSRLVEKEARLRAEHTEEMNNARAQLEDRV